MLRREEFKKQVIKKALLKIGFNPLLMKLRIDLKDYYLNTHIIMYQKSNTIYIKCLDSIKFNEFAKTHFDSWWVLREGDVTAISSLPLLANMKMKL
jgi:hypothetical protein